MTRLLLFDGPKAAKRFEIVWTAMTFAGENKDGRTPANIRKEARIQDMLDKISIGNNGTRELSGEPTLTLTQEDFDYLQQATEKVPWTPIASRDVVDMWDWLSAAEKED